MMMMIYRSLYLSLDFKVQTHVSVLGPQALVVLLKVLDNNAADNLPPYLPDTRHCSDLDYWTEEGSFLFDIKCTL